MVLKVDVVKAAEKELRRRRHNEANARYRASLSPVAQEASRDRNRETKRQQRASMTEEKKKEIREHDRVYRAGKRKLERSGTVRFFPLIPDRPFNTSTTMCWGYWLENDNAPVDVQKVVNGRLPPDKLAHQCSKCKQIFLHPTDARGHDYGIVVGDTYQVGDPKTETMYWFKPPCQPSNNIIQHMKPCKRGRFQGSPVYFPSRWEVQMYLKEHELYPECGLDRTYKKLLKIYNNHEIHRRSMHVHPELGL